MASPGDLVSVTFYRGSGGYRDKTLCAGREWGRVLVLRQLSSRNESILRKDSSGDVSSEFGIKRRDECCGAYNYSDASTYEENAFLR